MLGKLIKYDIKASQGVMAIIYGVFLLITVAARGALAMLMNENWAENPFTAMTGTSAVIIWVFAVGGVWIATLFLIVRRFYLNLFGQEGYLSLTLPVSPSSHLAAKMISGFIFMAVSTVVMVLSVLIMVAGTGFWSEQVMEALGELLRFLSFDQMFTQVIYFVSVILGAVQTIALLYASVCLGQLFAKRRVLGAVGAYLLIGVVLGFISQLRYLIFPNLAENYLLWNGGIDIVKSLVVIVLSVCCCIYIMKRKVNLN